MKNKQIKALFVTALGCLLITLVIYGCKKNYSETKQYGYFEHSMKTNKDIISMKDDLNGISKAILTEAYLKRKELSELRIYNSLRDDVDGKEVELLADAKAINSEAGLRKFYVKLGLGAQADRMVLGLRNHFESLQLFLKSNPNFQKLPKEEMTKLLYTSMTVANGKKNKLFRHVQEIEEDPCWGKWSEALEDAQDDQFWEQTGADVAFVLCCIATEGIGAPACYEGYLALSAVVQLHYIDNANKADNRYNECVGDQT